MDKTPQPQHPSSASSGWDLAKWKKCIGKLADVRTEPGDEPRKARVTGMVKGSARQGRAAFVVEYLVHGPGKAWEGTGERATLVFDECKMGGHKVDVMRSHAWGSAPKVNKPETTGATPPVTAEAAPPETKKPQRPSSASSTWDLAKWRKCVGKLADVHTKPGDELRKARVEEMVEGSAMQGRAAFVVEYLVPDRENSQDSRPVAWKGTGVRVTLVFDECKMGRHKVDVVRSHAWVAPPEVKKKRKKKKKKQPETTGATPPVTAEAALPEAAKTAVPETAEAALPEAAEATPPKTEKLKRQGSTAPSSTWDLAKWRKCVGKPVDVRTEPGDEPRKARIKEMVEGSMKPGRAAFVVEFQGTGERMTLEFDECKNRGGLVEVMRSHAWGAAPKVEKPETAGATPPETVAKATLTETAEAAPPETKKPQPQRPGSASSTWDLAKWRRCVGKLADVRTEPGDEPRKARVEAMVTGSAKPGVPAFVVDFVDPGNRTRPHWTNTGERATLVFDECKMGGHKVDVMRSHAFAGGPLTGEEGLPTEELQEILAALPPDEREQAKLQAAGQHERAKRAGRGQGHREWYKVKGGEDGALGTVEKARKDPEKNGSTEVVKPATAAEAGAKADAAQKAAEDAAAAAAQAKADAAEKAAAEAKALIEKINSRKAQELKEKRKSMRMDLLTEPPRTKAVDEPYSPETSAASLSEDDFEDPAPTARKTAKPASEPTPSQQPGSRPGSGKRRERKSVTDLVDWEPETEKERENEKFCLEKLTKLFQNEPFSIPDPDLTGWKIYMTQRTGGASEGKFDNYWISPDVKRHRSIAEVKRHVMGMDRTADGRGFVFEAGMRAKKKPKVARPPKEPKAAPPRKADPPPEQAVEPPKKRKQSAFVNNYTSFLDRRPTPKKSKVDNVAGADRKPADPTGTPKPKDSYKAAQRATMNVSNFKIPKMNEATAAPPPPVPLAGTHAPSLGQKGIAPVGDAPPRNSGVRPALGPSAPLRTSRDAAPKPIDKTWIEPVPEKIQPKKEDNRLIPFPWAELKVRYKVLEASMREWKRNADNPEETEEFHKALISSVMADMTQGKYQKLARCKQCGYLICRCNLVVVDD